VAVPEGPQRLSTLEVLQRPVAVKHLCSNSSSSSSSSSTQQQASSQQR
jgi:hypothetical protein